MDGESLLGPLPYPWEHRAMEVPGLYRYQPMYWNSITGITTRNDPRLGDLSPEWERLDQTWTPDDPMLFAPHRNKVTGNSINSDPRMLPEALTARGVKLETFCLV